jgi:diguanylate cyclase (GGDEF)-like protein
MEKNTKQLEELLEKRTKQLAMSETRFFNLILNHVDGIIVVDTEEKVKFVNSAAEALFCRTQAEFACEGLSFPVNVGTSTEIVIDIRGMQSKVAETCVLETDWDGQRALLIIFHDITERKKLSDEVQRLTYYDHLTGLINRTLFLDRLQVLISQAQRNQSHLAVIYVNLDRFKVVNDTFGHAVGDLVLTEISQRLLSCSNKAQITARLGGDEFALLLPIINHSEEAAKVAMTIVDKMSHSVKVLDYEMYVGASVGIALFPGDGQDEKMLLKNAHTAMHRNKDDTSMSYQFYTAKMNSRALELLEMENSLRRALENGEFRVFYQPQINIPKGIVGFEALVRWQHPVLGLVSPADFIPIAETTGLIIPIGNWVLKTACEQSVAWQNLGYPPVRMAVNLSAKQFQQIHLVDTVKQILAETGMEAALLDLEITESIAISDIAFTVKTLQTFQQMGIHISLDDFGTGFCSLGYLKDFAVQTLKIDRSFVNSLQKDNYNATIITTIIFLANKLNLRVIVEGVENQEQLDFFPHEDNIDIQGFYFSKPVPAKEIDIMFEQQHFRGHSNS